MPRATAGILLRLARLPMAVCIPRGASHGAHRPSVTATAGLGSLLRVPLVWRRLLLHPAFVGHRPKAHATALALISACLELQAGRFPVAKGRPLVVHGGEVLLLRGQEPSSGIALARGRSLAPLHLQRLPVTSRHRTWVFTPPPNAPPHPSVSQPLEDRRSSPPFTVTPILGLPALLRLQVPITKGTLSPLLPAEITETLAVVALGESEVNLLPLSPLALQESGVKLLPIVPLALEEPLIKLLPLTPLTLRLLLVPLRRTASSPQVLFQLAVVHVLQLWPVLALLGNPSPGSMSTSG